MYVLFWLVGILCLSFALHGGYDTNFWIAIGALFLSIAVGAAESKRSEA